jgi:hypothetical protein
LMSQSVERYGRHGHLNRRGFDFRWLAGVSGRHFRMFAHRPGAPQAMVWMIHEHWSALPTRRFAPCVLICTRRLAHEHQGEMDVPTPEQHSPIPEEALAIQEPVGATLPCPILWADRVWRLGQRKPGLNWRRPGRGCRAAVRRPPPTFPCRPTLADTVWRGVTVGSPSRPRRPARRRGELEAPAGLAALTWAGWQLCWLMFTYFTPWCCVPRLYRGLDNAAGITDMPAA